MEIEIIRTVSLNSKAEKRSIVCPFVLLVVYNLRGS